MSPPDISTFPAGLLARYEPRRVLGQGGMGVVFEAHDRELDRPVAIKCMRGKAAQDGRKRFRREASLLAGLSHPAIVQLYSFHDLDGDLVLIMELLEGSSLDRVRDGLASTSALLDVAGALREIHSHDLIHRDVKPANVLRLGDGRGVLIDFGLVHDDRRTQLTADGQALGTLAYMDPALLRGAPATPGSDWFGWAASLYALMARRGPYSVDDLLAFATAQASLPAPKPPREDLPDALWRPLAQLLSAEAEQRQAPSREFLDALASWTSHAPAQPRRSSSSSLPPSSAPSAARLGVIATAVAGCLTLGWWSLGTTSAPPAPTTPTRPRAGPEISPEAAALDAAWKRLAQDHLEDPSAPMGRAFFLSSRPQAHIDAVADTLRDGRLVLRVRRLAELFQAWWRTLPADRPLSLADRQRFERIAPGLLAHLFQDYRGLTDRLDVATENPIRAAEEARIGRRARDEFEQEVRSTLTSLDLFTPPRGDVTLAHLGVLIELLPPEATRDLPETLRRRAVSGGAEGWMIAQGSLHLAYQLARRRQPDCQGALGLLELGLDTVSADPELLARANILEHLLYGSIDLDRQCPGHALPMARVVAGLETLSPSRPIGPNPDRIADLAAILQRRGDPLGSRGLWWLAHKHEYLRAEPRHLRSLLATPVPPDADPVSMATRLGARASPESWLAFLTALVDTVERDALRADPERLATMVRALDAVRLDGSPESPEVERLLMGTMYRLDRPLQPPRYDRLLLLDALVGDLPFAPLWRLAWGNERTEMSSHGPARAIFQELFGPQELGVPIEMRARGPRAHPSPVDTCHFWSGRARGVQSLSPGQTGPGLFGEFAWWKIPERLQAIVECLQHCGEAKQCVQDLDLVEGWLEDYQAPLGPARKAEMIEACQETVPRGTAAPAELDPSAASLLAAFRQRCSEVGVALPDR